MDYLYSSLIDEMLDYQTRAMRTVEFASRATQEWLYFTVECADWILDHPFVGRNSDKWGE